jgi:DNA topoisomerase I
MLTKKRYILIKNSKNSKNKKKAFKLKKVKNRTKKKSIIGNNFWSFNKTVPKTIKKNDAKFYLDGKLVMDSNKIQRFNNLYIPPAYVNVKVAKSPKHKIQAICEDIRGRKQYIYHPEFVRALSQRKYESITTLSNKIVEINNDNDKLIKDILSRCRLDSKKLKYPDDYFPIIIMLLLKYHFRIGSHKYEKENKSYGIITLLKNHIKLLEGNKFCIEFVGKKGIINKIYDIDKNIYNILRLLIQQKNNDNHLFCYMDGNSKKYINSDNIKVYLYNKYQSNITPKMFRTWYANYYLLSYLKDLHDKKSELIGNNMNKTQKNELVKKCSIFVSEKLNNTPSISKKSYINSNILEMLVNDPIPFVKKIPNGNNNLHDYLRKLMVKK